MLRYRILTICFVAVFVSFLFLTPTTLLSKESFCDFLHLTHIEYDPYIYADASYYVFHAGDTLDGPVHSNNILVLRYDPVFFNCLSTSAKYYRSIRAFPQLSEPILFGAPVRIFSEQWTQGREEGLLIGDPEAGMRYRIVIDRRELQIFTWRNGLPFNDDLQPEILSVDEHPVIFVDSPLELMGVLDGELTIGCSQDIYLLDDLKYVSDDQFGFFDEEVCDDFLGVVSEQNIVIANTIANGKDNGFENRNNLDRHSIILNGAFLTLRGSFTFEDMNYDRDLYHGPRPDERGYIYLKGSLAQYMKGWVHVSNHDGTGYRRKFYRYDFRLHEHRPPLFPEIPYQEIPGEGNILYLNAEGSPYFLTGEGAYDSVFVSDGTEIILKQGHSLSARHKMAFEGTDETPITVTREQPARYRRYTGITVGEDGCGVFSHVVFGESVCFSGESADFRFTNCRFEGNVDFDGEFDTLRFENCELVGDLTCESVFNTAINNCIVQGKTILYRGDAGGSFELHNNRIEGGAYLNVYGDLSMKRNLIFDGISLPARTNNALLENNTVVHSDSCGIFLHSRANALIRNNIIAFNRTGLARDYTPNYGDDIRLCYNNVFGNTDSEYQEFDPGVGSISADPQFATMDSTGYYLSEASPCIDTGDPESEPDPDGSRADIGAFPYDPALDLNDQENSQHPIFFTINAYPNPFNDQLRLCISSPNRTEAEIHIYTLAGRQLYSKEVKLQAGMNVYQTTAHTFPAQGMYFVKVVADRKIKLRKVLYLK